MQTLEAVRSVTGGGFDPDVWHVMDQRDNELIEQEILHGSGSSKFVYSFQMADRTQVTGISVIGARHLAFHYKGLKHRLVASLQKTGDLLVVTSYPAPNVPMNLSCSIINELRDEPDFYEAVCEVEDVKTGNAIQMQRRENRFEQRRGGGQFERLHHSTIAQSKAYRNSVLALIPQDVQIRWKAEMLKLERNEEITQDVMGEKRANVLRFAAQKGIPLDRHALEQLTFEQIEGLGAAAREGALPAFVNSARALGLEIGDGEVAEPPQGQATMTARQEPQRRAAAADPGQGRSTPMDQDAPATTRGKEDSDTVGQVGAPAPAEQAQAPARGTTGRATQQPTGGRRKAEELFGE